MKRILALLLTAATFTSGAVLAHTELSTSVPENGATLEAAPENLQLTFSEPVRLTALSIQKDGERRQSLGPLPAETNAEFNVALPETIADGHYVVAWRALSADTHVMTGEFMFAVGDGAHTAHMNHAESSAGEHHAAPAGAQHGAH